MGKAKSKSRKRRDRNSKGPLRDASHNHDAVSMEETDAGTELLTLLDAPTADGRAKGCVSLAKLFESRVEERTMAELLDRGVLRKVFTRLCDPSRLVRVHAAGALRNMSICGGARFAQHMVKNDVVTLLLAAIDQQLSAGVSGSSAPGPVGLGVSLEKEDGAFLTQVTGLLVDVCESSALAVRLFTKSGAVASICRVLHAGARVSVALVLAVSQFLHTVTDDNSTLAEQLAQLPEAVGLARLVHVVDHGFDRHDVDDASRSAHDHEIDAVGAVQARLHLAGSGALRGGRVGERESGGGKGVLLFAGAYEVPRARRRVRFHGHFTVATSQRLVGCDTPVAHSRYATDATRPPPSSSLLLLALLLALPLALLLTARCAGEHAVASTRRGRR